MSEAYNKDRTKQKAQVIKDDRKDKIYVRKERIECKELYR